MNGKSKSRRKTSCSGILLACVVGVVITVLSVALAVLLIGSKNGRESEDNRPVTDRMAALYGVPFAEISMQQQDTYGKFELWTLQDSSGTECHVSRVQDYDWSTQMIRCYDDYRVKQQEQTPAVQRLLAQTDFRVIYESGIGRTAFNEDVPGCCWKILAENDDDILKAEALARETVMAEDSRLPQHDVFNGLPREECFWVSMEPYVSVIDARGQEKIRLRFLAAGEDAAKTGEINAYFYDRGK